MLNNIFMGCFNKSDDYMAIETKKKKILTNINKT